MMREIRAFDEAAFIEHRPKSKWMKYEDADPFIRELVPYRFWKKNRWRKIKSLEGCGIRPWKVRSPKDNGYSLGFGNTKERCVRQALKQVRKIRGKA